jgi:hypothetical protein
MNEGQSSSLALSASFSRLIRWRSFLAIAVRLAGD